ncbi:hypothetical protein ASD11_05255 [Aeromicrobium sp. Root495]|uniref:polyprenyl synthetase family protein n=1 Tax=Aeromicrobium sp. Root495 TaxID=1736550 RepID=UPI0006FD3373|nr:polyprenyl synthetase family protein [Aeromicrobium sp. Root495]KQY59016.1 hypothetical protein ASD11_05255 [Aeromicrobium sp. Root495]
MDVTEGDDFRDAVDEALRSFLQHQREVLSPIGADLDPLLDAAEAFVAGGKRLRPAFVRAGWLVAGGDPQDVRIVTAAAALEWLQASALVHDDLMDGSDTRRGRPSAHRAAEQQHRDAGLEGSPEVHGTSVAVLLGDLMLSWTDEQLRASHLPHVDAALHFLDLCRAEVVAGQYLDVLAQTQASVGVEQAMRVVRFKSAKYTVERPLHIGAALAGADEQLIEQLSAVALPLGEAFQLRDDVLGVFGDPSVTGKPAGDDVREGKRTVLVARTAELADDAGRAALLRHLGTSAGIAPVSALMVSTGALAAVEQDIARLEREAETAIDALRPGAREVLSPLVTQAVRRVR